MSGSTSGGYAGDVSVDDAWATLKSDQQAVLVDVRTQAEWAYVGIPDLAGLGKEVVLAQWQDYPTMAVDPAFASSLTGILDERRVGRDAPLLFLCRSGVRSKAAAIAATGVGYSRCFNVSGGFEGPHDSHRHRGMLDGWKARGHPWIQG